MMIMSVFRIVMVITHLDGFDQSLIAILIITFARQRNSSLIMGMEEEDTRGTLNRFFWLLSFCDLRSVISKGIRHICVCVVNLCCNRLLHCLRSINSDLPTQPQILRENVTFTF